LLANNTTQTRATLDHKLALPQQEISHPQAYTPLNPLKIDELTPFLSLKKIP